VYATVIYDVGLYYAVAACLEYLGEAESEEIVAYMPQVERLVGVR